jgi:hypothetical protein
MTVALAGAGEGTGSEPAFRTVLPEGVMAVMAVMNVPPPDAATTVAAAVILVVIAGSAFVLVARRRAEAVA